MTTRVYLLTEGVHDVFFLCKILKESLGFKKQESFDKLDDDWKLLVPTQFPHEDSLRASVPVPTFYKMNTFLLPS